MLRSALRNSVLVLIAGLVSCHSRTPNDGINRPVADARTPPPRARTSADAGVSPAATRARGRTLTLRLAAAAFAEHPEVLVHVPDSFVAGGRINLVVFLHGWYGCVEVIAASENAPCSAGGPVRYAMDLVRQIDQAAVDALLVVPQLAFDRGSSASGRLADRGGFRTLIAELIAHPDLAATLGNARRIEDVGRVVVAAHSGAFVPAAAIVSVGGLDVHELHLLDALYRDDPAFESWMRSHSRDFVSNSPTRRRFSVIYGDQEGTGSRSRALLARMSEALPVLDRPRVVREHRLLSAPGPDLYTASLFALRTAVIHEDIPRVFIAPLLETAGLVP